MLQKPDFAGISSLKEAVNESAEPDQQVAVAFGPD